MRTYAIQALLESEHVGVNVDEVFTAIGTLLWHSSRFNHLPTARKRSGYIVNLLDGLPVSEQKAIIAQVRNDDGLVYARTCYYWGGVDGTEYVAVYSSEEGWL